MKAVLGFGPGDVRLVTVPDPAPGAGQVLLKVIASGICGSDKWIWRSPAPDNRVHGHEVAGEVKVCEQPEQVIEALIVNP